MKKLLLSLMLCIAPTIHAGEFWTGNDLYSHLSSPDREKRVAGMMYVAGAIDLGQDLFFCLPNTVTIRQLSDIVQQSLQANASVRHESASGLILDLFMTGFPCKNKPSGKQL